MPSGESIERQIAGAWRLMTGHRDGLAMLDLSADGFWNSFFAMVVAAPALGVGWVNAANELGGPEFGSRLSLFLRLAAVDFASWVVPLVLLGAVARRVGIAHRFVPYVVASNWGSALFIWMMMPVSLVELVWTGSTGILDTLGLAIFVLTLVLSWRLTDGALGLGAATASWVFGGMLAASLAVLLLLQPLLGIQPGG